MERPHWSLPCRRQEAVSKLYYILLQLTSLDPAAVPDSDQNRERRWREDLVARNLASEKSFELFLPVCGRKLLPPPTNPDLNVVVVVVLAGRRHRTRFGIRLVLPEAGHCFGGKIYAHKGWWRRCEMMMVCAASARGANPCRKAIKDVAGAGVRSSYDSKSTERRVIVKATR